jgi:hypothetical protein
MQGRLQLVVAPAHQHVADVAGDDAGQGLDVGPRELGRLFSRTQLQPALTGTLVQQRETVEVGMGARAPAAEIFGLGVDHRQVVQKPQRALIFARQRVVAIAEEIRREAELEREAGEHLHAQRPVGAFEGKHRRLEARQRVSARP